MRRGGNVRLGSGQRQRWSGAQRRRRGGAAGLHRGRLATRSWSHLMFSPLFARQAGHWCILGGGQVVELERRVHAGAQAMADLENRLGRQQLACRWGAKPGRGVCAAAKARLRA